MTRECLNARLHECPRLLLRACHVGGWVEGVPSRSLSPCTCNGRHFWQGLGSVIDCIPEVNWLSMSRRVCSASSVSLVRCDISERSARWPLRTCCSRPWFLNHDIIVDTRSSISSSPVYALSANPCGWSMMTSTTKVSRPLCCVQVINLAASTIQEKGCRPPARRARPRHVQAVRAAQSRPTQRCTEAAGRLGPPENRARSQIHVILKVWATQKKVRHGSTCCAPSPLHTTKHLRLSSCKRLWNAPMYSAADSLAVATSPRQPSNTLASTHFRDSLVASIATSRQTSCRTACEERLALRKKQHEMFS